MTSLKKLAALSVVIVLITICLVWLRANLREQKRQAVYQATVAKYSRDLRSGITRDDVEQYIRSHGAQPESDQQPSSPNARDIMVRLDNNASDHCRRPVDHGPGRKRCFGPVRPFLQES